jgi:hypothetical protein
MARIRLPSIFLTETLKSQSRCPNIYMYVCIYIIHICILYINTFADASASGEDV